MAEDPKNSPDALFIITSDSLQTRGMAMVLANAMSQQGAQLHFLLCDSAGELAVADYESQALEPRGMRPEGLLAQLMKNSAKVEVCALYLPNSQYSAADLREGVTVAQPPEIARMMADENIRVFGF
ncbi:MAG: hypothetical protein EA349_13175 [Halomonadaceae bacterium]|nr:MAG: hypothetical protein EA349_13175 [Halomonadaceae bacterium]